MKLKLRKGETWASSRLAGLGLADCGNMCDSPSAPDYSGIAASNEKSAELAKEAADNQLAFSKEQYEYLKPYIQKQLEAGQQVSDMQINSAKTAEDRAAQQWNQYQSTFQPIEQKMAQEAMQYGTVADQEQSANQAGADVAKQFENQKATAQRQLASMGVRPNAGNFMAANRETDAAEAAARAAAMTSQRQAVKDKGISLRAGAAAFGRNQTNTAGQQVGLSTASGSAATQSAGAGIGSNLAASGQVAGGYGAQIGAQNTSIQANLGLGSLMNAGYQTQVGASGNAMAGLGQLAGTGAMLYAGSQGWLGAASSKDYKEDKAPVSEEAAVRAFQKLPVESWSYKEGLGDGGRHVGPYAEDVQRELGDVVAPGGKQIDLISMSGAQAAAIKGLADKSDRQEQTIEELTKRLKALTRGSGYGLRRYA